MYVRRCWTAVMMLASVACSGPSDQEAPEPPRTWNEVQGVDARVLSIEGFSGPESVRYDPDQDVWFVGNFNGGGDDRDGNGFVSRVSAETGDIESLSFAARGGEHPLHAPRGMFITGDTLWVADIDGVHGFHRVSGAAVAFIDLSGFEPGFLNDIAGGGDGALYVTDTGRSRVYRVRGRTATIALDEPGLGGPNGITWDPARNRLILVPWQEGFRMHVWFGDEAPEAFGPRDTPGQLDGVEPIDRRLLVASQSDSSLQLVDAGGSRLVIRTGGRPADIGVDTRRRRVAVPFIALNRVDIWQLPEE